MKSRRAASVMSTHRQRDSQGRSFSILRWMGVTVF